MKYLTCAETAKLVRQALKESFPSVKFSVRSDTYAGGASIDVHYTDGPKTSDVERVARHFNGSYFDGMIDYKGSIYHALDGEKIDLGADFVFVNRSYSDAMIQSGLDALYEKHAGNFEREGTPRPTVDDYKNGRLWGVPLGGGFPPDWFLTQMNEWLNESGIVKPLPSKTFDSVKVVGDDGYSAQQGCGLSFASPDRLSQQAIAIQVKVPRLGPL